MLVFGVFHVCFKREAFTISHNVESGEQGANPSAFLFHTQMKGAAVTFICLLSCALILGLRSYVSIFRAPHFCWGHETRHDFRNVTWMGCHPFPTLVFCHPQSEHERFLWMSVFTHWKLTGSESVFLRNVFPEIQGLIFEALGRARQIWEGLSSWPFCHDACSQEFCLQPMELYDLRNPTDFTKI